MKMSSLEFTTWSALLVTATILSWMSPLGRCAPSCTLSPSKCNITVLINGSYTGQIFPNKSITTLNGENICILSYAVYSTSANEGTKLRVYNTTDKGNPGLNKGYLDCGYYNIGVWLLHNETFYLNITRENTRPQSCFCIVSGMCRNWTQIIKDCPVNSSTVSLCNITCLNSSTICAKADYLATCPVKNTNDDKIIINSSAMCQKCGSPLQTPEKNIRKDPLNITQNITTSFSKMMNSVTLDILKEMGNSTTASVSLGDVQGIFFKPHVEDSSSYEPVSFVCSNKDSLNILQDETQLSKYPRSFSLPLEAFQMASKQNISEMFAAMFKFPNFTNDEKNSTLFQNEVYSIEMGANITNLTSTVNLTFMEVNKENYNFTCVSWDGEGTTPNWTDDGCITDFSKGSVACACSHLTFFAILMTDNTAISSTDFNNLTYITSIGCGLSLFFLSVGLFMHFLLRRSRGSDLVHILINLFVALFLLDLTFLTNEYVANAHNTISCKLMAGFMHYCMLASFTWFGLEALHLCLQLAGKSTSIKHYITKVCIAGWVPPAFVVTAIFCSGKYGELVITPEGGKSVYMCWILDSNVHYVVNIGYYSIIFLFTFTTFVITLRWLCLLKNTPVNSSKIGSDTGNPTETGSFDTVSIMGLCCVLGLTWGFAFFAYGALRIPSYYIFTILNSFQGFFLFIYYYKKSRFVGDSANPSDKTVSTTETTAVENPYEKPKLF